MTPEVQQLRASLIYEMDALDPQYAFTLNFNLDDRVSMARACDAVRSLGACLDRQLLGPRWHKKTDKRSRGLFLPEKQDTDFHLHGVVRIDSRYLDRFESLLEEKVTRRGETIQVLPIWREKIVPSGSCCVRRYSSSGWGSYASKALEDGSADLVIPLQP